MEKHPIDDNKTDPFLDGWDEESLEAANIDEDKSWFSLAAKSTLLNGLWVGPANILYWLYSERFERPYYHLVAAAENISFEEMVVGLIAVEMFIMIISLFVVFSVVYAAKARLTIFTSIILFVCVTVIWNLIGFTLGLR